jgi:hypothetical protein
MLRFLLQRVLLMMRWLMVSPGQRLSILSPLGPNPEKDRNSSRTAAARARMTNAGECALFLSFPRVAAARGIPILFSPLMKIDSLGQGENGALLWRLERGSLFNALAAARH